jgi:hypothetical protein
VANIGSLYDFLIYQEATTELDEIEQGVFGLAGAVVSKLSQRISEKNVIPICSNSCKPRPTSPELINLKSLV